MIIYNESKTKQLQECEVDLSLGHLQKKTEIKIHKAVKEQQEKGHYKVIKEYPNGGKDVEWIIDEPGVTATPERREEIEYYLYILFTEKELQLRNCEQTIIKNKRFLTETDYIVTKITEHRLLGIDTASDLEQYADVIQKREQARADINAAEQFLKENPINKEEI